MYKVAAQSQETLRSYRIKIAVEKNTFSLHNQMYSMNAGYIIRDQTKPHFITATVVDWIDVFTRKIYKDIVIDCFNFCIINKGRMLYGYVIMSNHIHLVVQSEEGKLSALIRDFKKFTARTILEKIRSVPESRREWMLARFKKATESHSRNKNYQFWQYGNHAEEIYSAKFLWSKLDYIHLNPVKAGIVAQAPDYVYSSASNYVGKEGVLKSVVLAARPVADVLKAGSFGKYYRE